MNSKTRKEKKASGFLSSKFFWLLFMYLYMHVDSFVDICKVLLKKKKTLQISTLAFYLIY